MPYNLKPRKQIRTRQTMGTAEKGKEQNFFWTAKLCEELKVTLAGKKSLRQTDKQLCCCYSGSNWETLKVIKKALDDHINGFKEP